MRGVVWRGVCVCMMRMNLQDIYQERELVLVVIKVGLILLGIKLFYLVYFENKKKKKNYLELN